MGPFLGGFIIGRISASEIWEAYFREGLFLEGAYGIFSNKSPCMDATIDITTDETTILEIN